MSLAFEPVYLNGFFGINTFFLLLKVITGGVMNTTPTCVQCQS